MRFLLSIIKYISVILTLLSTVFPNFVPQDKVNEVEFDNLGIPLQQYYPEGIPGRTAWDVEVYNDKLFVASGDYDKNIGPVHMVHYDFSEKQWIEGGTVADEQIESFYPIHDKLMAPGSDPRQDWDFGNIYIFEDGQWITKRTIPGGIHQLDMMEYDGQIFVGLGVLPGQLPIVVSNDGCETFRDVPMYVNGELFSTSLPDEITVTSAIVRCYDFFICNNTLYAFYYQKINSDYQMMIFRFEDNAFHFHSNLPQELSYKRTSFDIFKAKVQHQNRAYFTTGKLYVSDDMTSAEEIILEENAIVSDLRVIQNRLYAVTIQKNDEGNYTTSVWVKKLFSQDEFKKVYYFSFPSPAQSFTYYDGCFYFGMGEGILSESNETNGTVLCVHYPS